MKKIKLTMGYEAIVDDEDFEALSKIYWRAMRDKQRTVYAWGFDNGRVVFMHRRILGLTDPKIEADHKDGNGLNNTRSNLRAASHADNCHNLRILSSNTSGFKGVDFLRSKNKWRARIRINLKHIFLGYFDDPRIAANVYDEAAIKLHGEFASTNTMLGLL